MVLPFEVRVIKIPLTKRKYKEKQFRVERSSVLDLVTF